ncbi:hypothetical protein ACFR9U_05375 [Halorientalis brevis]|uniref:Uncharacterized protein n=1 Tax=Halorientalis brevis TaxID=1126241 RepID=A0ABD6C940_9EURY|nr:hypothetical protein [Halorientalis brevis]
MSDDPATDRDDVAELIADLDAAHDAYERATARVDERDEAQLQRIADHYEELQSLFDRYEEEATGDGDFKVFIEFQEAMAQFIDHLPDDLPHRERFEEVDDVMQQRRLTESDFAQAREILSPVADDVALLTERDATKSRYRKLRKRARRRVRELGEQVDDLESLQRLGDADLDAPVERIREPIETYNDAIAEAFKTFKREASARDVLSFVAATTAFPLVPYRDPPPDLREYVETAEAGTESITQIQEYADYSKSKLDHYVDDADALKRNVATSQTYLRRLDAGPLQIEWPPKPAAELQWRIRELVQVVGRFAADDVIERLRDVRDLLGDEDFERLRQSARAREQLTEEQRERLASGAVAEKLANTREAREQLEATLAELPDA